jgi:O-antigen/teichoic acid export membrane protein
VLVVLAAAQLVPASVGLAPHLLNMTGHEVGGALVMGVAVLVNVTLALLLIPRLGIEGGALATGGALLTRSVGHAVLVRRRLGLHTFLPLAWRARTP